MGLNRKEKNPLDKLFGEIQCAVDEANSAYPPCDLGRCSDCGGTFKLSKCPSYMEYANTFEEPYYEAEIHECPNCEGGGCIEDYTISRWVWFKWCIRSWWSRSLGKVGKKI